MSKYKNFLVIIPARKGSKRLLKKNRKKILGMPLAELTIKFASEIFPHRNILFSSNDENLLNKKSIISYGINIKKRKESLSGSRANINSVILEIINLKEFSSFEHIVLLQPTSPIRSKSLFKRALNDYLKQKKQSYVSAKKIESKYIYTLENKHLHNLNKIFIPNGNFYFSSISLFKRKKTFFHSQTNFYELNSHFHNIDIDFLDDFNFAKKYLENET